MAPFPESFPQYPSRAQFLSYLHAYARRFAVAPHFRANVSSARRDEASGVWRVQAHVAGGRGDVEYVCQWLVVATGENADPVVPDIDGLRQLTCPSMHAADYRSGEAFRGKRVLVVGCGNSGMEGGAGRLHLSMSVAMMRWLPLWLVDRILLAMAALTLGGDVVLRRPAVGPMELKRREGKTPVLDLGALAKIRSGHIKVVPEIRRFLSSSSQSSRSSGPAAAELVDGRVVHADAVVLATGYRGNVHSWLKQETTADGNKDAGLYTVGFSRRGLAGIAEEAVRIADELAKAWRQQTEQDHLHISTTTNPTFDSCVSKTNSTPPPST
ncbi:hypothetical protein EJB05_47580, partial [Eragrostis curvula]